MLMLFLASEAVGKLAFCAEILSYFMKMTSLFQIIAKNWNKADQSCAQLTLTVSMCHKRNQGVMKIHEKVVGNHLQQRVEL